MPSCNASQTMKNHSAPTSSTQQKRDPWYWYRLAQGLIMKNQPRAAADAINKAIALSPTIGDFHALVARLMIQGGQRIEAMRAVQNALRHGCQHTHGWQDLAVCANLLHRHHDAAKAFGEALRRTPNDVTLLCNAASNARHLGQLDQARQWLQRAVKIQPGNARAWWMLAPLSKDKAALATELETQWQRSPSAPARTYLGFALTHLHDALQNSDKAWHWAEAANRLVRKQQKHDQARWLARRQAHWSRQKQRWSPGHCLYSVCHALAAACWNPYWPAIARSNHWENYPNFH